MAATWLFLAATLVVYRCRAQLNGKVFLKAPGTRLDEVTVLSEAEIGSMLTCASLCLASDCNAYSINNSVTTEPRCMVATYSLTPVLINDDSYDLYIETNVLLPLKTNLNGYFGDWQPPTMCPEGHYVYGYGLWSDGFSGTGLTYDDCGVTGVELLCTTRQGATTSVLYKVDYKTTDRGTATCPENEPVDSFKIKLAYAAGSLDDEGMVNVVFTCQTSRTILHVYSGASAGTWSEVTQCPAGLVVCGMRVRAVIPYVYDDTCLNDLVVMCCFV